MKLYYVVGSPNCRKVHAVINHLGINVDIDPSESERHLNNDGLCFMFAPRFHSLSPTLAAARRSLGRPTIFNNLGPLCNPA